VTFCHVLNMLDEALVFFGLAIIYILRSLATLIHYINVPINMLFFSNKIPTIEEIAKEADETLFFKMQCKQHQHCLNPTPPPLKPNTHGLRPRVHSRDGKEPSFIGFGSVRVLVNFLNGGF